MRFPRLTAEGQSFYHCVSRVVDRRFIFQSSGLGSAEAERFVDEENNFSALLVLTPLTSSLRAFAWLRTRRFTATIPIPTLLSFSFPAYLTCPSFYSSTAMRCSFIRAKNFGRIAFPIKDDAKAAQQRIGPKLLLAGLARRLLLEPKLHFRSTEFRYYRLNLAL
jgi:hypothetical protein